MRDEIFRVRAKQAKLCARYTVCGWYEIRRVGKVAWVGEREILTAVYAPSPKQNRPTAVSTGVSSLIRSRTIFGSVGMESLGNEVESSHRPTESTGVCIGDGCIFRGFPGDGCRSKPEGSKVMKSGNSRELLGLGEHDVSTQLERSGQKSWGLRGHSQTGGCLSCQGRIV